MPRRNEVKNNKNKYAKRRRRRRKRASLANKGRDPRE